MNEVDYHFVFQIRWSRTVGTKGENQSGKHIGEQNRDVKSTSK